MDFPWHATLDIAASFALTLGFIVLLTPVARRFSLVDKPDQRKDHRGIVPLTGGLAIFLAIVIQLIAWHEIDRSLLTFIAAGGLLVITGALDDRYNLDFKVRILMEVVAASIMIIGADLWIGNLGDLLGFGEIHMPFWFGYLFTLIAVFGIVNAINMIDGMDGIAGAISLNAIVLMLLITTNSADLNTLGPLFCGGIAAFLACNLQLSTRLPKIFLGDAGSKLIGLSLVWFLIDIARSGGPDKGGINPATALYLVALPLYDMVTITVRRARKGKSPFQPDKTHIHHILQRAGFSRMQTGVSIVGLALALNLLGVALNALNTEELFQFALFFGLFLSYSYNLHRAWPLIRRLKRVFPAKKAAQDP